ncbi:hypothetical protein D6827_01395 [Candidatus Parcubacteria bacterium]|nr:MAG: hypothetical protein D6827_01395 [Candidatus Parcubacteria bacterium]
MVAGDVIGFSGLTNGRYFLADTDGEIQTTSGTIQVYAGKAVDTDKFIFNTGTVLDERPTVKQIDCILNASHNYDGTICVMGVSDNDNFAIGSVNPATPTETLIFRLEFNFLQQYQEIVITDQQVDTTTDAIGVLYIGDYYWLIDSTGSGLIKNGSTVTISGTTPTNIYALGYDGNNDYLLILESSTSVKRYSISGTTITYVDTITLDAAVSTINGFLFDKENNEFVFIGIGDIRIFNASGTTQRTITYPRIKGYGGLNGVVYYRNYLYAVYQMNYYGTRGSNTVTVNTISLIPLDIIRY